MDEDNIFDDDDDALDYILYEECTRETEEVRKRGGCLGMLLFLLAPVAGIFAWRGII